MHSSKKYSLYVIVLLTVSPLKAYIYREGESDWLPESRLSLKSSPSPHIDTPTKASDRLRFFPGKRYYTYSDVFNDTMPVLTYEQQRFNQAQDHHEQAYNSYQKYLKNHQKRYDQNREQKELISTQIKETPPYHLAQTTITFQKEYNTLEREYHNLGNDIQSNEQQLALYTDPNHVPLDQQTEIYEIKTKLYEIYQRRDALKELLRLSQHRLNLLIRALARHLQPYQSSYTNFIATHYHESLATIQEQAHEYAHQLHQYAHQKKTLLHKEKQLLTRKQELEKKWIGGRSELRTISQELANIQYQLKHCDDYRQKAAYQYSAAYKLIGQSTLNTLKEQLHNDIATLGKDAKVQPLLIQRLELVANAECPLPESIKEQEYNYSHYEGNDKHFHTTSLVVDSLQHTLISENLALLAQNTQLRENFNYMTENTSIAVIDHACRKALTEIAHYNILHAHAYTAHAYALHSLVLHKKSHEYFMHVRQLTLYTNPDGSLQAEYYEKRMRAAQITLENPTHSTKETYQLSEKAVLNLKELHLNYSELTLCVGDALQQQLHTEIVSIIENTSDLQTRYENQEGLHALGALTFTCADGARIYNQNKQITKSIKLIDWCYSAVDLIQACGEGVFQGVINSAHALDHVAHLALYPEEIPDELVKMAKAVAGFTEFIASISTPDLEFYMDLDPDNGYELYKRRTEQVHENREQLSLVLKEKWEKTPTRDMVKHGATFATEWILQGQLMKAGGVLGSAAISELKTLTASAYTSLELVKYAPLTAFLFQVKHLKEAETIAQQLPFLETILKNICADEKVLARINHDKGIKNFISALKEGYEILAARSTHILSDSINPLDAFYKGQLYLYEGVQGAQLLNHHTDIMKSIMQFYEAEGKIYDAIVTTAKVDAAALFNVIKDNQHLTSIEHIKKVFSSLSTNKSHIFGLEAKLQQSGLVTLSGFHTDPHGFLQKSGIFNFKNVQSLANGLYEAQVGFLGTFKKNSSTFFPQNWDIAKTAEKVIESWNNPKLLEIDGSRYLLTGATQEGIFIKTVIDETGKIITHYPLKIKR